MRVEMKKVMTRNEWDLETGYSNLPSPSPSPSPTANSAPALVLSNSGKRMDATGSSSRKKYVKQVTGRHNDTELHLAAQRGDIAAVRMIMAEIDAQMTGTGSDFDKEVEEIRSAMVNELNEVGETALFIAADKGHLDMVVELLRYTDHDGLTRKNQSGYDPLHVAAREGRYAILQVLLNHDPTLSKTFGPSNATPLIPISEQPSKTPPISQTLLLSQERIKKFRDTLVDALESSISAMRPIRLPEPPSGFLATPEIFEGGVNAIRRAVVIGNGFAGAENQSIGLVRALGLADRHSIYRVIRPRGGINEWLRWLPLSLHKIVYSVMKQVFGESKFGAVLQGKKFAPFPMQNGGSVGLSSVLEADARQIASVARENFEKEGPLLVVASGRDTISIASSIKQMAANNVFVIQIQHPRSRLERFDLVVTPSHDYYAQTTSGQQEIPRFLRRWISPQEPPSKNVVETVGALHQADSTALRIAATMWHAELAPLSKPLLVVNIGGPTRHCRYGADLAKQLAGSLHSVLPSCGSVRVSFSRRTPQKVSDIILRELGDQPKVYVWDGKGPNPHMGHLAWADAFVITADSVSMLSEACSTGKPVYVVGAERCKWKFSAFHKTLRERGLVRPFTGLEDISNSWSYPPLTDAADVAKKVREALAERGWTLR